MIFSLKTTSRIWTCKLCILFLSDFVPKFWKFCLRLHAAYTLTKDPWRDKLEGPGEVCFFTSPKLLVIELVVTMHSQVLGVEVFQSNHSCRVDSHFSTPIIHLSIAAYCFCKSLPLIPSLEKEKSMSSRKLLG